MVWGTIRQPSLSPAGSSQAPVTLRRLRCVSFLPFLLPLARSKAGDKVSVHIAACVEYLQGLPVDPGIRPEQADLAYEKGMDACSHGTAASGEGVGVPTGAAFTRITGQTFPPLSVSVGYRQTGSPRHLPTSCP